ncbi:MAG: hypothetical protein GXO73_02030 [Calditrichaeota bacterium]|nr:hypothetical protein [Calditrichota bacterium]
MKAKEAVESGKRRLRLPLATSPRTGQGTGRSERDLELLRAALWQINAGILVLDSRGKVLAATRDVATLFGLRRVKKTGEYVLPRGEIRRAILQAMAEVLGAGQPTLLSLPTAEGDEKDAAATARVFPVPGSDTGMPGAVLLVEQPTRQKGENQEREFSALFAEVASHVAHEIRNPLGTIGGFASLLEREFPDDDRRRHWVRKIIDAVARLDRMVTQLHLYVQPVKAQVRPADLVEKTREAFEFAEIKFGAQDNNVIFDYSFPDEPVYVLIDPHWWQEVVLTISANAIQAMKQGGRVGVRVEADSDKAAVVVEDEGEGIDRDMDGKIFYPFFSSKPDGTGLGLNVAKKLLRSMGAAIEISSEPGRGTNVRMIFEKV